MRAYNVGERYVSGADHTVEEILKGFSPLDDGKTTSDLRIVMKGVGLSSLQRLSVFGKVL